MAIITLKYNARNAIAASLIEAIKKSGVFTIEVEEQSPYDQEFVKKIERSAASEGKAIKTEDLYK